MNIKTILYFGIYNPEFSRNKIYIQGLRALGVEVIECQDNTPGFSKYWHLLRKHAKVAGTYDALIVGYPGHIVVPFAKLITWVLGRKPVIADLLGSLEDAEIYSHNPSFWRRLKSRMIDTLAVRFADKILLESEAQKSFFINKFGRTEKYHVVYTGAGEEFEKKYEIRNKKYEKEDEKRTIGEEKFKVLFRGRLTPESGIGHILRSAEILRGGKNISFLIMGGGQLLSFAEKEMRERGLTNVELVSRFLTSEELVHMAGSCQISLGQIEDNPRLNRTIPHKAFESFALGIPYLTGDAPAVSELVKEGKTGFLTPLADAEKLAEKIEFLSKNPELLNEVSQNAQKMFGEKLSSRVLAEEIVRIVTAIK